MENIIESIESDLKEIYRDAYIQYKPVVDRICGRKICESEVENILENLVVFCGDYNFFEMYKKICRYYIYDYTTMISYYVYLYRDMYEFDDSEAIENDVM